MPEFSNINVKKFEPLASPMAIREKQPLSDATTASVLAGRNALRAAIAGEDTRPVIIMGPCSIHDPKAAHEYASRLVALAQRVAEQLIIVMRVYFEKPRTSVGWKGLINDPHLDGSCDIRTGITLARSILIDINNMGLSCATEFLDPIVPQYLSDLVSWAAIGARTTESQTHREMASGLSMPVGFKNATDGDLDLAINGMRAARQPHAFLGLQDDGQPCVVRTAGNPHVHLVLRGGRQPNFSKAHLAFARELIVDEPGERLLMVDCSHGNSNKDFRKQPAVCTHTLDRMVEERTTGHSYGILGVMLESHLHEGNQAIATPDTLEYGKSITDACIGWKETEKLILESAERLARTV